MTSQSLSRNVTRWGALALSSLAAAALAMGQGDVRESNIDAQDIYYLSPLTTEGSFVPADATRELSRRSKLGASVLEIPRSVAAIDRYRIEERGARSIQDTLNYTAGVMTGAYGVDSRLDSARIRGADPLKFLDGFQTLFGYYNNTKPDVYTLESVEVVKGPASVLYGRGALGGIVNAVSKLPRAQPWREVEVEVGSHDRRQIAADVTDRLDAEGRFLYRVVGLYRESGTQVNHVPDDAKVFMPSFTWRPSGDTSLTLLANFQENKGGQTLQFLPNEGALLPGRPIPFDTFIGEPGWDRYDTEQNAYSLFFDQRLSESFDLTVNARYASGEADYKSHWVAYDGADPLIAEDGTVNRTIYDAPASSESFVGDVGLHVHFATGPVRHKVVAGLDYQDVDIDTDSYYGWAAGGRINLFEPEYGNRAPIGDIVDTPSNLTEQLGVYVRDQMSIGQWIVSVGARNDDVETRAGESGEPSIDDAVTTFDAGVMRQFENGLSPYVSWAESFEPLGTVVGLDGTELQLDPKTGVQREVGLKYQAPGSSAVLTVSAFDIVEHERPLADGKFVRQDTVDTEGFEIEGQANWKDLFLQAGYSYVDARDGSGNRLVTIADHQAVAWVTYHPSQEAWRGFKTGFGLRHVGERWDGAETLKADPYTLVDFMASYDTGAMLFQLNVTNLADERFVASTQGGRSFLGAVRNVTLSAKYRF